jgi:hypothetical protein
MTFNGEKRLTSNTGTSKKKVTSNRCNPNSKIGNGPETDPHGVGWGGGGVTADDDRGCYGPVDPPFDPPFDPEFDVI